MPAPLQGLRVLDFSTLLPGPLATLILAEAGAEVIKIERPGTGDDMRGYTPKLGAESVNFAVLNRGKKSVALDLKLPESVERVLALVRSADVLVEQFRPGVMDRLGVGYEALRAANPRVIYCAITGYGQDGPYKDRAGHDMNYLSIAGITGYNGRKASGPAPINVQVADVAGGSFHAVMGILAAVIHREKTGEGQFVDISMTDAAFSMHALTAPPALVAGQQPELEATQLNGGSFYDCYETKDGRFFSVGGLEPQFFMQFCAAIGKPELSTKGLVLKPEIVAEVKREIAAAMKQKTYAEWLPVFAAIDSCTEPVLSFAEACEHPQMQARGMLVDVPKPNGGTQKQIASAIKFSKTRPRYDHIGKPLGVDTDAILQGAGFDAATVAELRKQGVVA